MPIYEFECNCGLVFETICKYDEIDGIKCEKCGSQDVNRKISLPTIITESTRGTFSYRAKKNFLKAQDERREAQEQSHMGTHPYNPIDDMSDYEGRIV